MVKQHMSSVDVSAQVACLSQKLLGLRVANVYDINAKVQTLSRPQLPTEHLAADRTAELFDPGQQANSAGRLPSRPYGKAHTAPQHSPGSALALILMPVWCFPRLQTYMLKLSKSGEEGDKVFLVLESGVRFHTCQVRDCCHTRSALDTAVCFCRDPMQIPEQPPAKHIYNTA